MASATRRLDISTYGDANPHEISDFSKATLTRSRDGGDIGMTFEFTKPFRQFEGMSDQVKWAKFYYDDALTFEGRIKNPSSSLDNSMQIVLEGRAGVLREIKNYIEIKNGGTWDAYFRASDDTIDIGDIVWILYDQFVPTTRYPGWAGNYAHDDSIDRTTGVRLKYFKWDGNSSLFDVFSSLAKAAGYWYWGFTAPYAGNYYFQFQPMHDTIGATYNTRKHPTNPYLSFLSYSKELTYAPRKIIVKGGWNGELGRHFTCRVNNPSSTHGGGIMHLSMPYVLDATTAANICSKIFESYSEPQEAYEVTVQNLSSIPSWRQRFVICDEGSALGSPTLNRAVFHFDNSLWGTMSFGDQESGGSGETVDLRKVVENVVREQMDDIIRPTEATSSDLEYYDDKAHTWEVVGITTDASGNPTALSLQRIDADGNTIGDAVTATFYTGVDTSKVDVETGDQVRAEWQYEADDEDTRTLKVPWSKTVERLTAGGAGGAVNAYKITGGTTGNWTVQRVRADGSLVADTEYTGVSMLDSYTDNFAIDDWVICVLVETSSGDTTLIPQIIEDYYRTADDITGNTAAWKITGGSTGNWTVQRVRADGTLYGTSYSGVSVLSGHVDALASGNYVLVAMLPTSAANATLIPKIINDFRTATT